MESGYLSLAATFGLNHGWPLWTGLTVTYMEFHLLNTKICVLLREITCVQRLSVQRHSMQQWNMLPVSNEYICSIECTLHWRKLVYTVSTRINAQSVSSQVKMKEGVCNIPRHNLH